MPTPPMAVPHLAARMPDWQAEALCRRRDADHFYAPPHLERREDRQQREQAARTLCGRCPVQQACLDYALLVQEPHGIWGGLNELERRRLIRQRTARSA